ncbi:dehydrogenase/reductase SDR family member 7-like [Toxorhynchites rutilus septentrionalis]|uniref:dehydrogenase/reductase SDR family member 7-like n=1 Tax=Toxorhynchites rutilus septentrionalis TaxID=329112 RepID=UPI0024786917|nr:dehydrogenase/reductase SDR family member 7-like [Toxorhynchites rutilus septentrionalis]
MNVLFSNMFLFSLIGICVALYYTIQFIAFYLLDSDIELFILSKLGKPIDTLRGKVVWITGASSGIGRDLAIILAKHGVRLCVSSRKLSELMKVKQECLDASRGYLHANDVFVLQMDMLDIEHHGKYFKQVIDHFKTLDILVNNAGRSQRAEWHTIQLKVDRELFELDVFAVVNLSRIALNYFLKNSVQGQIGVTSSITGLVGFPNSATYTAAKHALHGYFETLQNEGFCVDVTIFCPGPTATNFLQECFTNKPGEKINQRTNPGDRRMTSERCAHLYAIALANKTYLSWAGRCPMNFIYYIGCYYPNVKRLLIKTFGIANLDKLRNGQPLGSN